MKPGLVKVLSIGGTVLGLVSTILGSFTANAEMKRTVAEEVAKALEKK